MKTIVDGGLYTGAVSEGYCGWCAVYRRCYIVKTIVDGVLYTGGISEDYCGWCAVHRRC